MDIFGNFDQLTGVAFFSIIRQLVKKSLGEKSNNGLLTVLLTLIYGIILNVALAYAIGNDIGPAIAVGLLAGAMSNVYNDSREIGK